MFRRSFSIVWKMVLTLRQLEFLSLLANGMRQKQIASVCCVSHRTVEKLLCSAQQRMKAKNKIQLTAMCIASEELILSIEGNTYVCDAVYVTNHTSRENNPRNSLRYKCWRSSVLQRDEFTCVDCGSDGDGNPLHAHHVKPWNDFVNHRFDVDNGITLCSGCHKARHSGDRVAAPIR